MAKINANGNISYLLLPLVFMVLSMTAGAVEITFYSNKYGCSGPGYTIQAPEDECAPGVGGSVQFSGMDECKTGNVFDNPSCGGNAIGKHMGNYCFVKKAKSAFWYEACGTRSRFGSVKSDKTACMSKGNPTSVVYTEASKEGTWVLKCSNAFEMYSILESLPEAQKVNWLKDNGAVFDPTSIVSIV